MALGSLTLPQNLIRLAKLLVLALKLFHAIAIGARHASLKADVNLMLLDTLS